MIQQPHSLLPMLICLLLLSGRNQSVQRMPIINPSKHTNIIGFDAAAGP